jgi:DNA-binding transcriptional regulator LsrR (DeoR family)
VGRGLAVVQAMGNIDSSPGPYDALELGRTLARRWEGGFLTLNSPALLPDADTRRRFLELPQIRDVMTQLAAVDLALVGVGTLQNSVFAERKALTVDDLAALRRAGAVGEILGRFFDAAGRPCATPLRERVLSLELAALTRVPEVIAVVSGNDRGPALRAAIAGGLIKSLVIDEGGAEALVNSEK